MAILEEEVFTTVNSRTIKHYENLGYKIPRELNSKGKPVIKRGAKILVKVADLPKRSVVEVTKVCDDCGSKLKQPLSAIMGNRDKKTGRDRCNKCGRVHDNFKRKKSIKHENSFEYWAIKNNKNHLLNEFSHKNEKTPSQILKFTSDEYIWECPECAIEYKKKVIDRTSWDSSCPRCHTWKVNEFNCLWATNPETAKLLLNSEDGYKYRKGSGTKLNWRCPSCNNIIKNKFPRTVINHGLSCSVCSDGLSYPEKFMMNVLKQLGVNPFTQKVFEWSLRRKYDFYVEELNYIIETHGLQHYKGGFERAKGRTLEEEQENDKLKENLAKMNHINTYIIIDCRKSEMEWIKSSVLNSKLNDMYDLSNIDWMKCHEYACNSLVKTVSELWNGGMKNRMEITKVVSVSRNTTLKYLKQGAELGWCDYSREEAIRLAAYINSRSVVRLTLDGEYVDEWKSMADVRRALNISGVSYACMNSGIAGGFKWEYKEDYENRNKDVKK